MLPIPGMVRGHFLGAGRGRHRAALIHEPDLVRRERHVALADAQALRTPTTTAWIMPRLPTISSLMSPIFSCS